MLVLYAITTANPNLSVYPILQNRSLIFKYREKYR